MFSPPTLNSWMAAPWARKVKADSGDWGDIFTLGNGVVQAGAVKGRRGVVWMERVSVNCRRLEVQERLLR